MADADDKHDFNADTPRRAGTVPGRARLTARSDLCRCIVVNSTDFDNVSVCSEIVYKRNCLEWHKRIAYV